MGTPEANVFLYKDKYTKTDKGFLETAKNIGPSSSIIKTHIVYSVMNNFPEEYLLI